MGFRYDSDREGAHAAKRFRSPMTPHGEPATRRAVAWCVFWISAATRSITGRSVTGAIPPAG